jgi:uncharacterized membrane protein
MARILVAGESWQTLSIHTKGFDSFVTSDYAEGIGDFRSALESAGHLVEFQPSHIAAEEFPDTEDALSHFDAVVLSDIGSNTLLLPPATFSRAETRPNRLVALRNWVAGGGGFAMVGGYLSFQGIDAKANYGTTPLAEVLPVELERGDDRQETPEGSIARTTDTEHPVTAGVSGQWPALLGFQRLVAKKDADVLAAIGDWPLLVAGRFGKGRVIAFASDIGPHWAPQSFTQWPGYTRLWSQALTWLADG